MNNKCNICLDEKMKKRFFNNINPQYNLKDFLLNMTKDDLDLIRRELKIKGISKLKKSELILELEKFICNNLKDILNSEDINQNEVQWIFNILNNNGISKYSDDDFDNVLKFRQLGIVFTGKIDDELNEVIIIPNDLRIVLKELIICNKDIDNNDVKYCNWVKITNKLLYYYGVLKDEDAYRMLKNICNEKVDFYEYIVQVLNTDNNYYKYDKENRIVYLKDVERPLYTLHEQRINNIPYFNINFDIMDDANKKFTKNAEILINKIIKTHNVSRDTAEKVIKNSIKQIKNQYSLNEVAKNLLQFMNFKDEMEMKSLLSDINNVFKETRIWAFKGHTFDEMNFLNKSKGKTILSTKKIGRNDLCPCGSGKKYKKCCGR